MNILNIEHIHKIFGDKVIFDDISCGIDQGEKIGIIGVNGTGKTTLLRVIAGEEEPDEGQVITQNGIRISWLPQTPEFPQHMTILDYVAEGKWQKDWSTESEARRMLNTLGITDQNINMDNLSGGEKKRVALARMLLNPADILILDEPTNHLDGEMVIWLEDFLRNFRGTVIMVTHDRYFLDRVANRILEISHGKLYSYAGDYSRFLELKAQREEMELASDRKRRSVLRMELEWAARGCRARSTKQRARLDRLEALKAGKTPLKEQNVEMDSIETRMGKKTIEFHHVSKTIEGRLLINDFDHIVLRDQRLGIIGPNGCGKSTLLKMADGLILPDSGEIQIGETIRIGYLAQNVPDMDGRQRVIDYIREVAEYVPTKEGRITASQMLERFLFDPAMQYSCGYWENATNLEEAQRQKMDMICRKLQLQPGMNVLDIGCGWGGLGRYMAREYGVRVTGVTVSEAQARYAREHGEGEDLRWLLQDYRTLSGTFDRIVSVGMFEHVGRKNYAVYMDTVRRLLAEDGLFLLHTIGGNKARRCVDPWIEKYIFKNGILPSIHLVGNCVEGRMVMEDWENFGAYYDKTLMCWAENFARGRKEGRFQCSEAQSRMFLYYLLSCAGAFRARDLQLWQIVLSPRGVEGGYRRPKI